MPSRQTPIPETIEKVPGYPDTLRIFKIPASKFYWTRASFNSRFITRSTKTELRSEAMKAAKAFYQECLLKHAQAGPIAQPKEFEKAIETLIAEDQSRVDRGERKASLVKDAKHICYQDLLPFFRHDRLKNISYSRITEYVEHARSTRKKPLSTSTLKNHFIFLSKILTLAQKNEQIDRQPVFPTLSTKANPREWFTSEQYRKLRDTIRDCEGETAKKTYVPIGRELGLLTTFMVNTFLRPPDIKNLRNRHIEVVKSKDAEYLRILPPGSKTTDSPIVSMPNAIAIYQELKALHGDKAEADDFVFLPQLENRGYAFQTMRLQFNHVLEKAALKRVDGRAPRTLYSLRHTAIMFRLVKGDAVDLLTLARNCRTSVDMLEKFYASHLKAEMNVALLQSMK